MKYFLLGTLMITSSLGFSREKTYIWKMSVSEGVVWACKKMQSPSLDDYYKSSVASANRVSNAKIKIATCQVKKRENAVITTCGQDSEEFAFATRQECISAWNKLFFILGQQGYKVDDSHDK